MKSLVEIIKRRKQCRKIWKQNELVRNSELPLSDYEQGKAAFLNTILEVFNLAVKAINKRIIDWEAKKSVIASLR